MKAYKHTKWISFLLFLLPVGMMYGQADVLKGISDKFLRYCSEIPREEVFLHTDRSEFIAGEEIWFSALLLDRQTGKREENRSIVYVEILNSENRTVGRRRVETINGSGSGEILLPDTLSTGCYTIRAYTSWMKNFLPCNCFYEKIGIYNSATSAGYIDLKSEIERDVRRLDNSRPGNGISSAIFSVNIEKNRSDNIDFSIETTDGFRNANNSLCYIFIETHGIIEHSGTVRLTGRQSSCSVPRASLGKGISHITFFNAAGYPVAERYIYIRGKVPGMASISAPDSCAKREKISVAINLSNDKASSSGSADFSVSVILKEGSRETGINNYLVFGTEFGSLPVSIAGKNPDEIPSSVIDSFLTTASSNWIDWNMILSGRYPPAKEPLEKGTHFLPGRLINTNTHQPVANKTLILSNPGKNATFQYYVTDNNGRFRFEIPLSEDEEDLVIQPWEGGKNNSIELLSPFDEIHQGKPAGSGATDKKIPGYLEQWSTNYQVNRIYGIDFSEASPDHVSQSTVRTRFYGKPDIELILNDYIKLPVMTEVFFELLPGIKLKSHDSRYEIAMINPVTKVWQKTSPVLFIDGVMISDATAIAGLDPELVDRLDVIKGRYIVGNLVFNGLINVITKRADFSSTALPDQAVRIKYRAVDRGSSFREPEFSDPASGMNNIPDFRNTLYWNPSVLPDKNGKYEVTFRASDLAGEYEINVQGFASDGQPFSVKRTFVIK